MNVFLAGPCCHKYGKWTRGPSRCWWAQYPVLQRPVWLRTAHRILTQKIAIDLNHTLPIQNSEFIDIHRYSQVFILILTFLTSKHLSRHQRSACSLDQAQQRAVGILSKLIFQGGLSETWRNGPRVSPRFTVSVKETVSISHILDILHVKSPSGSSKNLSPSLKIDLKRLKQASRMDRTCSICSSSDNSKSVHSTCWRSKRSHSGRPCQLNPGPYDASLQFSINVNKTNWFGWKWVNPHFFILSMVDFFNNSPFGMSPVHALSVFWKKSLLFTLSRNVTKALNSHISCRSIVATSRFTIY